MKRRESNMPISLKYTVSKNKLANDLLREITAHNENEFLQLNNNPDYQMKLIESIKIKRLLIEKKRR